MTSSLFRRQLFAVGRNQRQHGSTLMCCVSPIARIRGWAVVVTFIKKRHTSTTLPAADDETANATAQKQAKTEISHHSHLHILGSGSIGLMLAASIRARHPDYPLTLLLRDHHASRLVKEPILGNRDESILTPCIKVSLKQFDDSITNIQVPAKLVSQLGVVSARNDRQQQEEHGTSHKGNNILPLREKKVELVLLTTKAFQAVAALQSIQSHLAPNCRIVVLCNGGLAVRDELMRYFSDMSNTPGKVEEDNSTKWNVQLASITHGAFQAKVPGENERTYRVVHAGVGQIFLVGLQRKETVVNAMSLLSPQMLEEAGLHPKIVSQQDMENILWYKLAANCVCNPLTAIHQCTNGLLHERVADFDTVLQNVVEEVCLVYRCYTNGSHSDLVDTIEDDTLSATSLDPVRVTDFVRQVIEDNFDNHSSMQQDVLHHRPTEIEFLNGYIVRMGLQCDIDCRVNRELRDHVLALQATYPS